VALPAPSKCHGPGFKCPHCTGNDIFQLEWVPNNLGFPSEATATVGKTTIQRPKPVGPVPTTVFMMF
jgi:hypothetical protein